MLEFSKGRPPRCLTKYQTTRSANWETVTGADKQELRTAACGEQGFLCVYCERRIRAEEESAFIEHWIPRSTGEGIFTWSNLLAVCRGEVGGTRHCDRSRPANTRLCLQPVRGLGPSPERYLRYRADGEIVAAKAAPAEVERDVAIYLNLNAPHLKRARAAVYDALREALDAEGFSTGAIRRELKRHTIKPGSRLPEQTGIARYQLERWLRKKEMTDS